MLTEHATTEQRDKLDLALARPIPVLRVPAVRNPTPQAAGFMAAFAQSQGQA